MRPVPAVCAGGGGSLRSGLTRTLEGVCVREALGRVVVGWYFANQEDAWRRQGKAGVRLQSIVAGVRQGHAGFPAPLSARCGPAAEGRRDKGIFT